MKKIIIIVTLLFSSNCFAITGNDLYALITSDNNWEKSKFAYYVIGVMSTQSAYKTIELDFAKIDKYKPKIGFYFCPPAGISNGQALDLVQKYLHDNPAIRHESGFSLVHSALKEAWPCNAN